MEHEYEQIPDSKPMASLHGLPTLALPGIDGAMHEAPVLDVADVIAMEQRIASAGTSLYELMRRAGSALAHATEAQTSPGERIVVLAGPGNNGGDGWVAAAELARAGRIVTIVTKACAEELTAEPARTAALESAAACPALADVPGSLDILVSPSSDELEALLASASLIIDAILGTGFSHDSVREPYATWIGLANAARITHTVPIIAADCPSGLNAQTGFATTSCITADTTITMLAAKPGLVAPHAHEHVGKLIIAPLIDRV